LLQTPIHHALTMSIPYFGENKKSLTQTSNHRFVPAAIITPSIFIAYDMLSISNHIIIT